MVITASNKYVRVSPQKVKFVADAVRKMSLADMKTHLSYLNKEAARKLLTTLNQALGNAQHNYGLSQEQLMLDSLLVLRGPQYKRMRPRSRGQGHAILKRTTHIVIKLKSVEPKKEITEDIKSKISNVKTETANVKSKTEKSKTVKTAKKEVRKEKTK